MIRALLEGYNSYKPKEEEANEKSGGSSKATNVQLCNYVDDSQHGTFRALGVKEEQVRNDRRGKN